MYAHTAQSNDVIAAARRDRRMAEQAEAIARTARHRHHHGRADEKLEVCCISDLQHSLGRMLDRIFEREGAFGWFARLERDARDELLSAAVDLLFEHRWVWVTHDDVRPPVTDDGHVDVSALAHRVVAYNRSHDGPLCCLGCVEDAADTIVWHASVRSYARTVTLVDMTRAEIDRMVELVVGMRGIVDETGDCGRPRF